jgi:hypothetical protein
MLCAQCSRKITRHYFVDDSDYEYQHYRCCDANVCSLTCAVARRNQISSFDPDLVSPITWPHVDKTQPLKLKRSYSERLLQNKNSIHDEKFNSIDILSDIDEEESASKKFKGDETFSLALLFATVISMLCFITL